MADVRGLFQLDRAVALGAVALSLLCVTVCYVLRRPDRQALRGFRDGLRGMLTVLAALMVWGAVDFDSLFILFHRLAFTNDLWLLNPETDLLIRPDAHGFLCALRRAHRRQLAGRPVPGGGGG